MFWPLGSVCLGKIGDSHYVKSKYAASFTAKHIQIAKCRQNTVDPLMQGLALCGFHHPWSNVIWKYQMKNSRNSSSVLNCSILWVAWRTLTPCHSVLPGMWTILCLECPHQSPHHKSHCERLSSVAPSPQVNKDRTSWAFPRLSNHFSGAESKGQISLWASLALCHRGLPWPLVRGILQKKKWSYFPELLHLI